MSDFLTAACIYCERDVMPPIGQAHAEDCPTRTGIYPVLAQDVNCPGGCGCVVGLRCAECDGELEIGQHYALLTLVSTDQPELSAIEQDDYTITKEVVCLVCAAKGEVTR